MHFHPPRSGSPAAPRRHRLRRRNPSGSYTERYDMNKIMILLYGVIYYYYYYILLVIVSVYGIRVMVFDL